MSWRSKAAPIIAQVLADTAGQDERAIRKALHDAYPYGARKWHPYKIWLSEIKHQRHPKARIPRHKAPEDNPNQIVMEFK